MNYWLECVTEALSEAKVSATPEQISEIAECVKGAHENYGMAFGHDCIPNPLVEENKALSQAIQLEREKVTCRECNGRGVIVENFCNRSSSSRCDKCNGEGRHRP